VRQAPLQSARDGCSGRGAERPRPCRVCRPSDRLVAAGTIHARCPGRRWP